MIGLEKMEPRWVIWQFWGREGGGGGGVDFEYSRKFEIIRENSNILDIFLVLIEGNYYRGSNNPMEETSMEQIST